MVLVSPAENSNLDSVVECGFCHIYDPDRLDLDAPPSENQTHLKSDLWLSVEDMR